jgi:myosin-5
LCLGCNAAGFVFACPVLLTICFQVAQLQAKSEAAELVTATLEQTQQDLDELQQANNRTVHELEEEQSAHQMKLKTIMDLEAQVAELESQVMAAEQAVLQSAHDQRSLASRNSGESLQTPEPMMAPPASSSDEYIEVSSAVDAAAGDVLMAALQAEVDALKDQLAVQNAAASSGQSDALLTQLRSDLQTANLRCKQLDTQAEQLKQETAAAVAAADKLRKENKDLYAGASLPTPAAPEAVPTQGAGDGEGADSPKRQQGLDQARTDIARLQLANTKLMEKANELEKDKALAEGKLARLGGNADPAGLQREIDSLAEQVKEYQAQLDVMVAASVLDEANEEIELLTRQLQQLQADYDSFMTRENMLDLAKAKTTLQEKNHQLTEELAAVRTRLTDAQEEVRLLTGSLTDVQDEKRAVIQHKNNLEQALSKKLSSGQPNGAVDGNLLQEEVRVLIDENLAMREQVEVLEDRLKAALHDRPSAPTSPRKGSPRAAPAIGRPNTVPNNTGEEVADGEAVKPPTPAYVGMLKFQEKDIQRLVGALVVKIRPELVTKLQPHLPAHLLFMCVLYADAQANGAMLQGLLTKTMRSLKAVVTQNSTNLERLAFWLANGFRLLTNMKQFSGDPQFSTRDDPTSRSLQTFDLMEYRRVLSDLLVQIYHTVVKHVEVKLTPMIVPGLLEFESLPGGAGGASGKSRGGQAPATITDIFTLLTEVHGCLVAQNVEPRVVQSVFRQVYYNMNAVMVNTLLLRKDLARLTKGMQVRYNITKLEEWARTNKLEPVCGVLSEAVQLTQLLQCPKSSADHVETIFETCTDLNPLQIQKMLQMYTPEEYEDRVPASLLRAVSDKQNQTSVEMKLLLDTKHIFPVTFPFSPCAPRFPSVEIPVALGLDFVEKI